MRTIYIILLIWCSFDGQAQITFDPERDTLAANTPQGLWKFRISEPILIQSARMITPELSNVQDVRVQDIHGKPYLFFKGAQKDQPDTGFTVMIQLVEISKGIWKAGTIYQACWGALCSKCGFDEYWGCACERYDGPVEDADTSMCNHMIALGMGLGKVEMPQTR